MLPFLDQAAVLTEIENARPTLEIHRKSASTVVPVFGCPADPRLNVSHTLSFGHDAALTSFLGVQGTNRFRRDGVLFAKSKIRLADIADGSSHTLAVGERPPCPEYALGLWSTGTWSMPGGTAGVVLGVREACDGPPLPISCGPKVYQFGPGYLSDPCDAMHFWSLHFGGAHFMFADGGVRFVTYSATAVMPALATRAGGEAVDIP
jgi:hypothetical protein